MQPPRERPGDAESYSRQFLVTVREACHRRCRRRADDLAPQLSRGGAQTKQLWLGERQRLPQAAIPCLELQTSPVARYCRPASSCGTSHQPCIGRNAFLWSPARGVALPRDDYRPAGCLCHTFHPPTESAVHPRCVSRATRDHIPRPSPRPRDSPHEMPCPRHRPSTSRPANRSITGRHGIRLACRSPTISAMRPCARSILRA
jgi:hypothetical protein